MSTYVAATATAVQPTQWIDVHVIAASTTVPHGSTETKSREQMAEMDRQLNLESNGRLRVRQASYQVAAVGENICDLWTYEDRLGGKISKLPRPADDNTMSTWLVTNQATCGYGGLARLGSAGMHVPKWGSAGTPFSESATISVGIHELGHNLGLTHAAAQQTGQTTFPGVAFTAYGSAMSVMSGGDRDSAFFTARERIQLGWTDAEQIAVHSGSRTHRYTISPHMSPAGVSAVLVPLDGDHYSVVSYRDGSGRESSLASPRTDGSLAGEDNTFTNVGVHVEAGLGDPVGGASLPGSFGSVHPLQNGRTGLREALQVGETVNAARGVRVKVIALGEVATVEVTTPADTKAPELGDGDSLCGMLGGTEGDSGGCYAWSYSDLSPQGADTGSVHDNVAATSAVWSIDGKLVGRQDFNFRVWEPDARLLVPNTSPLRTVGTHVVSLELEDGTGNVRTYTTKVRMRKEVPAAKKYSRVRGLKVKVTGKKVVASWKQPAIKGTGRKKFDVYVAPANRPFKYFPTRVVAGTKTSVKLTKLIPGLKYKVLVEVRNEAGISKPAIKKFRTKWR